MLRTQKDRKAHTFNLPREIQGKLLNADPYSFLASDDAKTVQRCIKGLSAKADRMLETILALATEAEITRAQLADDLARPPKPSDNIPRLNPHDIDVLNHLVDVGLVQQRRRVVDGGKGAEVVYSATRLVREAYLQVYPKRQLPPFTLSR